MITVRPPLVLRDKLILLFVVIKIVPLALLAWFAWKQASGLGQQLTQYSESMVQTMRGVIDDGGRMVVQDATQALDSQARDTIEHLTTETARHMADFLYQRDHDLHYLAQLPPSESEYRRFLSSRRGWLHEAGPFTLNPQQTGWQAEQPDAVDPPAQSSVRDNDREFHARSADRHYRRVERPLYLEMTYVDRNGQERIRVGGDGAASLPLRNVADPANTYARAETYFADLQRLQPGQIYVSPVIGPYVRSSVIGPYTPQAAARVNRPYAPQDSAFAGRENPLGRRFQGLVRWAMPVSRNGHTVGYVTLALDHRHIMEFTDILVPTNERIRGISDASEGNYAMTYAANGRVIAHPRHYTIVGYDPGTGRLVEPWMDGDMYGQWKASGLSFERFMEQVPAYEDLSLRRKPASEQIAAGTLAVYCGYSNFAPQCAGWRDLTAKGGSGSFLLHWSGLWKLSTAAAIPYYSGDYGRSPTGFGWVSITANLEEFHRAATQSKTRMQALLDASQTDMERRNGAIRQAIETHVHQTLSELLASTLLMVVAVIGVAVWLASLLSRRIRELVQGIHSMEQGDILARLPVHGQDELGQVAASFNAMADRVSTTVQDLADKNAELKKIAYASSHDFQEPLRSIVSFSQLLLRRHGEQLDQDGRDYLNYVVQSALRMRHLVGDLRMFVEAVSEQPLCLPVDSDEVIRGCVVAFTDRLSEIGGCVHVESLPRILADRGRLALVMNELLENAIRHRHPERPLAVYIRAEQGLTHWTFAVTDNGNGIESSHLPHIFHLFEKLPSPHDGMGTGIGLPLCQKLLRSQKGDIRVESEQGAGCTVIFTLPALNDV